MVIVLSVDIMKKSWRNVEIEQQTAFGFTKDKIKPILDEWTCVSKYAFILQDRCKREDGTDKEPHIHCMIAFKSPVPTTAILNKFNSKTFDKYDNNHTTPVVDDDNTPCIWVGQLEKIKSWDSAIAYLTHENRTDKTRYSRDEIVANYDFNADIEKALNPIKDERLNAIITAINDEKMRRYNYMDFVTAQEYVKYKRQIEDAFAYVNDRNISKGMVKNMRVMYLYGDSGTGKTTYARHFCEDHNLSYYVSSGSNDIVDGYGGQDVLIVDELRPSTMGLSDLLKLLDNNTTSTVKSRYYNKCIAYCKFIIITSVLDIDSFFRNVFKEEKEPIVQLKRRCETLMKFTHEKIYIYKYDATQRDYIFIADVPNVISLEFKKEREEMTKEKAISMVQELFSSVKQASINIAHSETTLQQEIDNADNPFVKGGGNNA